MMNALFKLANGVSLQEDAANLPVPDLIAAEIVETCKPPWMSSP